MCFVNLVEWFCGIFNLENLNGSGVSGGVGSVGIGSGTYQSPVDCFRSPVMICSNFLLKTNI